jgi:predicted P-loop ATPase
LAKPVQADYLIILAGKQGLRKSTTLRALCPLPRFFRSDLPDLGSPDAARAIADAWIIELAELTTRKFKLLEALAEHVCAIVTNEFKAPWVRLSVAKLGHIRNVRKVGVVLERRRDPGE